METFGQKRPAAPEEGTEKDHTMRSEDDGKKDAAEYMCILCGYITRDSFSDFRKRRP